MVLVPANSKMAKSSTSMVTKKLLAAWPNTSSALNLMGLDSLPWRVHLAAVILPGQAMGLGPSQLNLSLRASPTMVLPPLTTKESMRACLGPLSS